jgi:prefoldin subunit 5
MARNKARRPGGPSRPPSDGEGPPSLSASAERAEGSPGGTGPAAEDARAEGSSAAERARPEPLAAEPARPEAPPSASRAAAWSGPDAPASSSPATGGPLRGSAPTSSAGQRPSGAGAAPPLSGPPGPASRGTGAPPKWPGSWLAGLAAGVIGGIVAALALTWALSRDNAEVAALRAQIDRLAQTLAGVEGQGGEVAQLTSRLEALESGSGAALNEEVSGRIEALVAADAALQERLDALGTDADQGAAGAQVDDLAARVDELEAAIADAGSGAGASEAVTQRLAELENQLSDLSATVAQVQQVDAALRELTSRTGALEARLAQAEAARQDLEQLAGRFGALEQQVAAGREEGASQLGTLSTRMDMLADTVEQVQTRLVTSDDRRTRAATLALIIAQLDAALDGGEPFEELLNGLRALGVDDPAVVKAIATLEAAAASGVVSLPELRAAFDRRANEIVHAERAPDGDGLLDQAAGNLMRLVTVRPVGADVEGDSAAARVARAEAALATGDLAAAVAELEGLQGAAAEAAAPWLAEARERLAAQDALGALQDRATHLLSEPQ